MVISNRGFPHGSAGKASACNAGDLGMIPGLESSPGEGKGYPLQLCGLENLVNGGDKELDTTEDMPHINKQFGS